MKRKLLFLSALMGAGIAAQAQFSGYFAPANWTQSSTGSTLDASIDVSGAPASITIFGSDDDSGDEGEIFYSIVLDDAQTISFDFDITHTDECCDDFRIYQNTSIISSFAGTQTGSFTYDFSAGDLLQLSVYSSDNVAGALDVTISNLNDEPLPVTGGKLSANKQNNSNTLSWTTFTESNNKGFEIQRSYTAKDFQKIGFVPAKSLDGNSTAPLSYIYTDLASANAAAYYRYKQIDIDGKEHYSNIAAVLNTENATAAITTFPSPTSGAVNVITGQAGTVKVFDFTGKMVMDVSTTGALTIDLAPYPAGVYNVEFIGAAGNSSTKVTKL